MDALTVRPYSELTDSQQFLFSELLAEHNNLEISPENLRARILESHYLLTASDENMTRLACVGYKTPAPRLLSQITTYWQNYQLPLSPIASRFVETVTPENSLEIGYALNLIGSKHPVMQELRTKVERFACLSLSHPLIGPRWLFSSVRLTNVAGIRWTARQNMTPALIIPSTHTPYPLVISVKDVSFPSRLY